MSTTEMLLRLGITANYKGFLYLISVNFHFILLYS